MDREVREIEKHYVYGACEKVCRRQKAFFHFGDIVARYEENRKVLALAHVKTDDIPSKISPGNWKETKDLTRAIASPLDGTKLVKW